MITNELKSLNHKNRIRILSYLNGHPSGENFLIAFLISRLSDFTPFNNYPYIYRYEHFVRPPYSQFGKYDLILTSGRKYFLVVEAKYFQDGIAKSTIKNKRSKVRKQARKYRGIFQQHNPSFIVYCTTITNNKSWTNEHPEFLKEFSKFQTLKQKEWKKRLF